MIGFFTYDKADRKVGVMEINKNLLNSLRNSCSKKVYAQGFDWKYITFKNDVNKFEHMEMAESIYEGVLDPS